MRLTVRGRRVLVVLALVIATAISVGIGAWIGTAGSSGSAGEVVTVTVAPGETLWTVAGAAAAPGDDVRDVIAEIAELNSLVGADIRAGQQLFVPAG
ncbi:LysM peptidoglycan-binding domain-containing protein [Georgenia subflava]|uniref:LysM peptidoglycan-binding domain-containing protein n=2 Tax=Georgenia subflava TaxID=1622177 RepID=A0A6N7EG19_9MICO|nr:LysM peptidoglycan-binding domain-containing protein [Georgenia subflava]